MVFKKVLNRLDSYVGSMKEIHDMLHVENPLLIRGVELAITGSIAYCAALLSGIGCESAIMISGVLYLVQEKLIKHRDEKGVLIALKRKKK